MAARETPATRAAREAGISFELHEYEHDPRADSSAREAAEALGLDPDRVFKSGRWSTTRSSYRPDAAGWRPSWRRATWST